MDDRDGRAMILKTRIGPALFGLLALAGAVPARAVDGVIEINQARATAGSVTVGDLAGFPVSLTAAGSYRLTSDLAVPANTDGISVTADNVTLDLNGFSIVSAGGATLKDGTQVGAQKNIEIKNGTIRGFGRAGFFSSGNAAYVKLIGLRLIGNLVVGAELEGQGHLVDHCMVFNNGGNGLRVFDGSLVINSVVRGNTGFGLDLIGATGYGSNVLTGNNGGDANAQVSGGFQLGSNVCGSDLVCP